MMTLPRVTRSTTSVVAMLLVLVCTTLTISAFQPSTASAEVVCPNTDVISDDLTPEQVAESTLCLINGARAQVGLYPLTYNAQLALAAQRHSDDMQARGYFDHIAPDPSPYGSNDAQRAVAAGYTGDPREEILAMGQATTFDAVNAWMHSTTGHCRAIMTSKSTEFGVGVNDQDAKWTLSMGNPDINAVQTVDPGVICAGPLPDISGPAVTNPDVTPPVDGADPKAVFTRPATKKYSRVWTMKVRTGHIYTQPVTVTARFYTARRVCKNNRCANKPGSRVGTKKVRMTKSGIIKWNRASKTRVVVITIPQVTEGDQTILTVSQQFTLIKGLGKKRR